MQTRSGSEYPTTCIDISVQQTRSSFWQPENNPLFGRALEFGRLVFLVAGRISRIELIRLSRSIAFEEEISLDIQLYDILWCRRYQTR